MQTAQAIPRDEITLAGLAGRTVAVLGYGAQGHAHALNLRDSGVTTLVAQRPGPRHDQAVADGFEPCDLATASQRADLLVFGLPDDAAPALYAEHIGPNLRAGQTLGFIHGFVVHYRLIRPPPDVNVVLVAPKSQGRGVRREFLAGRGVLSLIAAQQDADGAARRLALGWAAGIGSGRAGALETTFADETETDLFGEQAVLCGGLTALIKAGFETLVEAGYPAELAYFECCHEVKLLADLIYEHGLTGMRDRISTTARFGDLTRGPRVIGAAARNAMRAMLEEIRSGRFAEEFAADNADGRRLASSLRAADLEHPIEQVGERIRGLMWGEPARPAE